MDFFISDALAQAAPAAQQEPGLAGLILPLAILAVFFFLFVVPQQRKAKEQKKMVDALAKGSEVVTTGGLLGRVVDVDDNFVQLELAENLTVHLQKHAVASLVPKGTYKARKKGEKA